MKDHEIEDQYVHVHHQKKRHGKLGAILFGVGLLAAVGLVLEYFVEPVAEMVSESEIIYLNDFLPHDPEGAREATRIKDQRILPGFNSHSGFATVNEEKGDHLFWWFVEASNATPDSVVRIWLQGGPGASSLFALFTEIGPFTVEKNELKAQKVHWAIDDHLLFIDNPVGVGFSHSETGHFVTSSEQAGENLVTMLEQFYQAFPHLAKNDLYICGESFAGHYIPAFGAALIARGNDKIPFKGVAIGNGWVSPLEQLSGYPEVLYSLGLIENVELKKVQEICDRAIKHIEHGNMDLAYEAWDEMISGDESKESYFKRVTGLTNYFNYLPDAKPDNEDFAKWLNTPSVRHAIHAGNLTYKSTNNDVELALKNDVMRSYRPELESILHHGYKALIYNGQLDIIVNVFLTRKYLAVLDYEQDEYHSAPQKIWGNGKSIYGYTKQAGNLTTALVRGCGHMVPTDQPEAALDLINKFTSTKPAF